MGTPMTLPAALDIRSAPAISPLLAFLAGSHAAAMARVWPTPHEDFLALPAARRHAAAILAGRSGQTAAHVQWMAARARDGELAAELYGEAAPGGLVKALGRMGEVLWRTEEYARFLALFGEPEAAVLIRHMKVLRPEAFAIIAALPPALRLAPVVAHLDTDEAAAADLASAWSIAIRVRSESASRNLAQRFSRAKSRGGLFEMAREVILPQAFLPVAPPPDLPAPFQPVRQLETLNAVALEFRNCLRDFVGDISGGRMAVYVWRGDGGPAAVALRQDPAGWRLAEARGRDNVALEDAVLMAIAQAVQSAGVRTGESWGGLLRRLEDRAYDPPTPAAAPLLNAWRMHLALGNLWD
jgi:hypothetical protein